MKLFLLLIVMFAISLQTYVFAQEFAVSTDRQVYVYGDYLSFVVTVPKVTNEIATFRIIDDTGMGSSSIQMAITGQTSTLTAPNPFEPFVYREGTYTIQVTYDGQTTATEFVLVDSGTIVIPFWIKDVAELWSEHVIDDKGFLKSLVDNDIIKIDNKIAEDTQVSIPSWYKTNAQWWKNGIISDDEFVQALQYMIEIGAVIMEEK